MLSTLFAAPVSAAYHLVLFIAGELEPLFGPNSTAAAIVLFTIGVRCLLLPLSAAQFRSERTRARLMPAIQELHRTHRHDPQRLQRELATAYAEHGTSPFAGCLPTLGQLPIFSVLYQLFAATTVGGQPNLLLTRLLADTPLGTHWFAAIAAGGLFGAQSLVFLLLFALLGAVACWSASRLAPQQPSPQEPTTLTRLLRLLPFGTVVIAAFLPLADGLYLLTTTAWTVAERSIRTRQPREAVAAG